jgi:hypothetical protein
MIDKQNTRPLLDQTPLFFFYNIQAPLLFGIVISEACVLVYLFRNFFLYCMEYISDKRFMAAAVFLRDKPPAVVQSTHTRQQGYVVHSWLVGNQHEHPSDLAPAVSADCEAGPHTGTRHTFFF